MFVASSMAFIGVNAFYELSNIVLKTSVVRFVAMGHVNHFNFSGRRAYFPRVQWEQTAVS